ncbi:kielin/chordin-like protein [Saccoglossus kowalevskii]|uniref:IgGFc-binding protein-like n=1 Tax=Saccoglossus kowalevskii TaxID=10224 RepID=A0ABM0M8Y9_SACKO|nr:PREDICTED: IgGFc-binding protein-like [Saccoglossus kowalevskii]
MKCDTKIFAAVLLAIMCQTTARVVKRADGNPHDLMLPGQGMANQCLKCKLSEKLSLAECLMKPDSDNKKYEDCKSSRPECMTQLWNWNKKMVFASECQQIEACIEESSNEPWHNNCDSPPIIVSTKCRYCCNAANITQGYYCPLPSDPMLCKVWGDPRFSTFDGYKYHEGGDCDFYTLLKMDGGNHDILVQVTESEHQGHYRVETMKITQAGQTLNVGTNNHDGTDVVFTLPGYTINVADFPSVYGQFNIGKIGDDYNIYIDTDLDGYNDLLITWGFRRVELKLTQLFDGDFPVEGLCGNADGDSENELIMPNGATAPSDSVFHSSWGTGCPP